MAKGKTALVKTVAELGETLEKVIIQGDLSSLKPEQKVDYYNAVCESVGLNPLTRPFAYMKLSGKETLYALKGCTDQLRQIHGISIKIVGRDLVEDIFTVTARASNAAGREDEDVGSVPMGRLQGEPKANANMKAHTKAKRRVTLSFCGLGMLDETEVETIQGAVVEPPPKAVDVLPAQFRAEDPDRGKTFVTPTEPAPDPGQAPDHDALERGYTDMIAAAKTKPELDKIGKDIRDSHFPEAHRKRLSDKWLVKSYTFQNQGLDEASGEGWKDAKEAGNAS